MLMLYICKKKSIDVCGVVEGDDGLFRVQGGMPTIEDFANVGWTIKLVGGMVLGEMGFCKQYFDPDVLENVVSPAEILVKTGWTQSQLRLGGRKVRDGLLRAKADSLVASYANAPIARCLAEYIYRCVGFEGTRAYEGGWSRNYWENYTENERPRWKIPYRPDMRNYLVVERVFGVAVSQQLAIEEYLNSLTSLQELDSPEIQAIMLPQWQAYHDRYTAVYPSDLATAMQAG